MQSSFFLDIPHQYKSLLNSIKDVLIKKMYSNFNFLYYSCIINDSIEKVDQIHDDIEEILFNYLKKFKFATYYLTSIPKINDYASSNKNFNLIHNMTDVVICIENICLIIDKIEISIFQNIIDKLKKHQISIINTTKSNLSTDEEKEAQEEIENFKYLKFRFQRNINEFVECTISPIICYLIRRYFQPTSYFIDQTFFTYKYLLKKSENIYRMLVSNLLFDYNYTSTVKYLNYQNEMKNNIVDYEYIIDNQEFHEKDFIILRSLGGNNSGFYLVLHIESLYIFWMKKVTSIQKLGNKFDHEVEFNKNYAHRCFTHFYGFLKNEKDEINGFIYEFMSNGSLSSYVSKNPNDDLFNLMTINRIIQGIEYLQKNSLIHRDLKPSNILLDNNFVPFISDFETIRKINKEQENEQQTVDFGSLFYMAPEQIQGYNISFPTDIYSFGLIIYFLYEKKNMFSKYRENNNDIILEMTNASNNIHNLYVNCVLHSPNERPNIREIKNVIIDEIKSFSYIEKVLLRDDIGNMKDLIINFFYEGIIIQIDFDENSQGMHRNLCCFEILYEIKCNEEKSSFLLKFGLFFSENQIIKRDYAKSKKFFELSAELNNPNALNELGNLYDKGYGVQVDHLKAKYFYEKAAKCKISGALINLGDLYFNGNGVEQSFSKAKEYYDLAAEQNDSNSFLKLGDLYLHGYGVDQNYDLAKYYFERAAELDNTIGYYNLGFIYEEGVGVNIDYKKSHYYFQKAAEKDHPEALFRLGNHYQNGFGCYKNFFRAKFYYDLAAGKNCSNAFYGLGYCYLYGLGTQKNIEKAFDYFELAAQKNNVYAIYDLGLMYFNGDDVKKDYSKAKYYFDLGVQLGHINSLFHLGLLYFFGFGVKKDYIQAKHYFELAANKDNVHSLLILSIMFQNGIGVDKDYSKTKQLLEKAAKFNCIPAINRLGILYQNGIGVVKDYLKARYYFDFAANEGDIEALYNLGVLYEKGLGVQKDYLKAKHYYEIAEQNNDPNAINSLAKLYKKGLGVKQDYLKAFHLYEISAYLGDSDAYFNLGKFYENEKGFKQNYSEAKFYYELSAEKKNPKAMFKLGVLYSTGDIFEIDNQKAIYFYTECCKIHNNEIISYDPVQCGYLIYTQDNKYYNHACNNLGLIYITEFNDFEKGNEFVKIAGLNEYPFGQNNFGLIQQFFLNNIEKAEHMYKRASDHRFALSEYNLGYLKERDGNIEESIKYYIKASEHENEPLVFHNHRHYDKRLEISKKFIILLTNLKLVDYYLSKYYYNEAKMYFIKAFSSLNMPSYEFKFELPNFDQKSFFKYLKNFILNFPLFNLRNQKNIDSNLFEPIETPKFKIEDEKNKYINMQNLVLDSKISKSQKEKEQNLINDIKENNFVTIEILFDFAFKQPSFIDEIKEIINIINSILYNPPYSILFGRIKIQKLQSEKTFSNYQIKDINELFYEGFELDFVT